jgi:hypothetical protein
VSNEKCGKADYLEEASANEKLIFPDKAEHLGTRKASHILRIHYGKKTGSCIQRNPTSIPNTLLPRPNSRTMDVKNCKIIFRYGNPEGRRTDPV